MDLIEEEVRQLLSKDNTGHGFDHVLRVCRLAEKLARQECADVELVRLAALLHDVDDYKLFGAAAAQNLSNAYAIMQKAGLSETRQKAVADIIRTMGYSKALQGIRPQSSEGKVVSDADMLDAIGALGIVRCLTYAAARCETVVFDEHVWPEANLSAEEYKKPGRASDNFINHFFEKLLKLKSMMLTSSGRREAEQRHKLMVDFLYAFFREQGLYNWIDYLENFEREHSRSAA